MADPVPPQPTIATRADCSSLLAFFADAAEEDLARIEVAGQGWQIYPPPTMGKMPSLRTFMKFPVQCRVLEIDKHGTNLCLFDGEFFQHLPDAGSRRIVPHLFGKSAHPKCGEESDLNLHGVVHMIR